MRLIIFIDMTKATCSISGHIMMVSDNSIGIEWCVTFQRNTLILLGTLVFHIQLHCLCLYNDEELRLSVLQEVLTDFLCGDQ